MLEFLNEDIFDVDCDMVVIPFSSSGTMSASFKDGLARNGIKIKLSRKTYKLGDVEIQRQKKGNFRYIAFVCTVSDLDSSYSVIRRIGRTLGSKIKELERVRNIASPILGTGAGGLKHFESRNILLNAFYETANPSVLLTICTTDKNIFDSFLGQSLDIDTLSSHLVMQAEFEKIISTRGIKDIINETKYYYQLAQDKFQEFIDFKPNNSGFFENLFKEFKSSKLTFSKFLPTIENEKEKYNCLKLCGELISYIDYHAYFKNVWNMYSDKRVLAHSGVNQTNWTLNLLKFKIENDIRSITADSIVNAFRFLFQPGQNLTMLAKHHREKVFESFGLKQYEGPESQFLLFDFFKKLNIDCTNPINRGVLFSRILYLPFIKPIWLEDEPKDRNDQIFVSDIEDVNLIQASQLINECLKSRSPFLDIGNCGLKDLSILPELFECIHLEELILSNQWAIYENGKWREYSSQNVGRNNNLSELPQHISKLKNLKRLTCGGDWNNGKTEWNRWGIENMSSVFKLENLEYLNLSNNLIKNINGLNNLTKLKTIHLNNNNISSVRSIGKLKNLEEIYLSNNKIKTVSFLQNLEGIHTVDLHNNLIKDLRPLETIIAQIGIENSKWKKNTLNVAKNPLELPPMSMVTLGKEAVLSTFKDIKSGGSYINKDVKIILVGNSEVGKSTLVKYLDSEKDLDKPHPATHWMDEKIVKSKYKISAIGEECVLHLFDFGGHDYYHDTHHLFYSSNTIYILLWDKETNNLAVRNCVQVVAGKESQIQTQDYPIKYWLESVKHHIKDVEADNFEFEIQRELTYNSALILIQNKVGQNDQIKHLNNENLFDKFPFIYDFLNISIKDPRRNLEQFDSVFTETLNSISIIGAKLPRFYEVIKKQIAVYSGPPVLSTPQFLDYCNTHIKNHIDIGQCTILARYLEQIGIILFSKNANGGKVYIDKKWVIASIYKVLEELNKNTGEFDFDHVKKCLNRDEQKAIDILEIMTDFKIIFKHPDENKYIAPLYLPAMPSHVVSLFLSESIIPYRRFEYPGFIQKHVVLSFFKEYGKLITGDKKGGLTSYYYWKDGLIIKQPVTEELVMIRFNLGNESGGAFIDVFNIGNKKSSVFINEIVNYIKEINKDYEIEEMVTLDGTDFISLQILSDNAKNGKLVFTEERLIDKLKPKAEKEKFYKLKDYSNFITSEIKKKKVVISYSKKNVDQIHILRRYLKPIVHAGLIEEPWYCTDLLPGDDWDNRIKAKFDEADIIFFMVSEFFFNTQYIIDYEIKNAITRYDTDKSVKIIPIILEFYDWKGVEPNNLQRFTALPYQAKPISDFSNPKIAWHTITASVKLMIEKDLDPGKIEMISRDIQEIYERQVSGKLDNNY